MGVRLVFLHPKYGEYEYSQGLGGTWQGIYSLRNQYVFNVMGHFLWAVTAWGWEWDQFVVHLKAI